MNNNNNSNNDDFFQIIPDDILCFVLIRFLDSKSKKKLKLVSKRMNIQVKRSFEILKINCKKINSKQINLFFLKDCHSLRKLTILYQGEKKFTNIPELDKVTKLKLDMISQFDLSKFPKLEILRILVISPSLVNLGQCNVKFLKHLEIVDLKYQLDLLSLFPNLNRIHSFIFHTDTKDNIDNLIVHLNQLNNVINIPGSDFGSNFSKDQNLVKFIQQTNIQKLKLGHTFCFNFFSEHPSKISVEKINFMDYVCFNNVLDFILKIENLSEIKFTYSSDRSIEEQINYNFVTWEAECDVFFSKDWNKFEKLKKMTLPWIDNTEMIATINLKKFSNLTHLSLENVSNLEIKGKFPPLLEFINTGGSNTFDENCFQDCQNLKKLVMGFNFTDNHFSKQNSNFEKLESLIFFQHNEFIYFVHGEQLSFRMLLTMKNLKLIYAPWKAPFHFFHIFESCQVIEKIYWGSSCKPFQNETFSLPKFLTHLKIENRNTRINSILLSKLSESLVELILNQNNIEFELKDILDCKKLVSFSPYLKTLPTFDPFFKCWKMEKTLPIFDPFFKCWKMKEKNHKQSISDKKFWFDYFQNEKNEKNEKIQEKKEIKKQRIFF